VRHSSASNPFHQAPHYSRVTFTAKREDVTAIESAFGDVAVSVSSFEQDEKTAQWKIELLLESPVDEADINARCVIIKEVMHIDTGAFSIEAVEKKDWLSEVARMFPPLSIGRFFIHGSHHDEGFPASSIPLLVDAGAAFGSGEHGTTSGCLLALEYMLKRKRIANVLDMGCGSGILAIAFAKAKHKRAWAVDIDPVSVRVTSENTRFNQVHHFVRCRVQNGYQGPLVKQKGPFDLVFANILARPLTKMAKHLKRALKPGGVAILSGLLHNQERMVLAAHEAQGLRLIKRWHREGWSTLLIRR
jgi:ribosomal protein L11 methyltransferase